MYQIQCCRRHDIFCKVWFIADWVLYKMWHLLWGMMYHWLFECYGRRDVFCEVWYRSSVMKKVTFSVRYDVPLIVRVLWKAWCFLWGMIQLICDEEGVTFSVGYDVPQIVLCAAECDIRKDNYIKIMYIKYLFSARHTIIIVMWHKLNFGVTRSVPLRPRQIERHFADDIFKCIFFMKAFEFQIIIHWNRFLRI